MPNTPVRAAAEGMPAINRRHVLAGTAATAAVAFMASPAEAAASRLIASAASRSMREDARLFKN